MINKSTKGFIISIFVTIFGFTSTIIFAVEEETPPEEETILGVPCQPFPECIVDSLEIKSNFVMVSDKGLLFQDETISRPKREIEEELSAE